MISYLFEICVYDRSGDLVKVERVVMSCSEHLTPERVEEEVASIRAAQRQGVHHYVPGGAVEIIVSEIHRRFYVANEAQTVKEYPYIRRFLKRLTFPVR